MSEKKNWNSAEREILERLKTPFLIQEFLDGIPYSSDPIYRSPACVMRDCKAHCFDGAVFAAAALEQIGFPPLIMELKAVRDDDHLLALYRIDRCWGAVAKSNFVGLRFREPIHRSLRELAISYFDSYFNIEAEKTLRSYSMTVNLDRFNKYNWHSDDAAMDRMAEHLDRICHYPLLSKKQIAGLARVDTRTYQGEMFGTDVQGLFDPAMHKAEK